MLNAMIYCLSRRIQFQIYSADANFGTGIGWTEYFQPFCKEVHEAYHAKYNFHRPPSWKQVLKEVLKQHSLKMGGWKTKMIVKTMVGRIIGLWTYHEKVLLSQDIQLRTDIIAAADGQRQTALITPKGLFWCPDSEGRQGSGVTPDQWLADHSGTAS